MKAMFIKLFATKIVANNFLGFVSSRCTISSFFEIDLLVLVSKSEDVKEKKATSEPETSAEQTSKTKSTTTLVIWVKSKNEAKKYKSGGSVSKFDGFSYKKLKWQIFVFVILYIGNFILRCLWFRRLGFNPVIALGRF